MAQDPYGQYGERRDRGREEREGRYEGDDWRRTEGEDRSFDHSPRDRRPGIVSGRTYGGEARRGDYGASERDRFRSGAADHDRSRDQPTHGHGDELSHGRTAEPYWPYGDRREAYGSSGDYWPYGEPADREAQRRFRPGPQEPAGRGLWERTVDQVGSWLSGDRVGPGQYSGLGPKGYKRSDSRIHEDVSDALAQDAWLDASDIEVTVQAGEVTLSGTVRQREDKRRAELFAEHCPGVTHVQNNLRVGSATPETR